MVAILECVCVCVFVCVYVCGHVHACNSMYVCYLGFFILNYLFMNNTTVHFIMKIRWRKIALMKIFP